MKKENKKFDENPIISYKANNWNDLDIKYDEKIYIKNKYKGMTNER